MSEAFEISIIVLAALQFLLFVTLVVLVLKLVKSVSDVTSRVEDLKNEIKEISEKVEPVIRSVNDVVETVGSIAGKVNDNMSVVNDAMDKLKGAVEDIVEFERKIRRKAEPPVMEVITTFSAVVKGVTAFVEKIKGSKRYLPLSGIMGNGGGYNGSYEDDNEFNEIEEVTDVAKNEINKRYEDINKELEEVRSRLSELSKSK